jgi:hypothetical protein
MEAAAADLGPAEWAGREDARTARELAGQIDSKLSALQH